MLHEHFSAHEQLLQAVASVQDTTGHSLHKGTPREIFVREFLSQHLGRGVDVGTGEVIDSSSKAGEKRNQHDVVVYRNAYPTLDIGGGIKAFLAESVIATIEVKSTLREADIRACTSVALKTKSLEQCVKRSITYDQDERGILSYIIAYRGPRSMETVMDWIQRSEAELGVEHPETPHSPEARLKLQAPALDAVFLLGKGFAHVNNVPLSTSGASEDTHWFKREAQNSALLGLFVLLTWASTATIGAFDPRPYLIDSDF